MASLTPPQMYRAVLRQFVQNARSPTVSSHLRQLFETARTLAPGTPAAAKLARDAENMVVYLKAHRLHKSLVERYNPTNVLTGEERARMSAKVVGLSMPKQYDAKDDEGTEGTDGKPKGSLQQMFSN